jgi:predicted dehydrogenase
MNPVTRRSFLRTSSSAAGALALAQIVPSRVLGADAPGRQVAFGFVGVGGMGASNIERVLKLREKGARIVAVCDVDRIVAAKAAQKVDAGQGGPGCAAVGDFREITGRKDIDAIVISTPDHWHALTALDAIRNGKDVYVEKPLTHSIREGRVLVDELRKHGRVGQTGTMQRSDASFRYVAHLIAQGQLGKVGRIDILIPANNKYVGATWSPEPAPEGLDYDFWLGPAPWAPYARQRTHYQFRYIMDYAGGQTTNWGAHYIDIAQWALGADETGPVEISGSGEFPSSGLFTAPTRVDFTALYAGGVRMRVRTRTDGVYDGNVKFFGERGWIDVSRSKLKASDDALLKIGGGPGKGGDSGLAHMENFLDCIRSRARPVADLAIGHRTTTVCNLGNIAMQLRRPLNWDPAKEAFLDDLQANWMRSRAYRGPWRLI